MKINIITPVSRPQNVPVLYDSIINTKPANIDVKWFLIFDVLCVHQAWALVSRYRNEKHVMCLSTNQNSRFGHSFRNMALNLIEDPNDWIFSLDDDNIVHPNLFEWLIDNEPLVSKYDALLFDQEDGDGSVRLKAAPESVKPFYVDTAQYMYRKKLVGDVKYRDAVYEADGIFIEELYKTHTEKFLFVNKLLCYYNFLAPE